MKDTLSHLRSWFVLTKEERIALATVLVIALIGLLARYQHLKNQKPESTEKQELVSHE